VVDLGIALLFRYKEAGFFESLQLALYVTRIFFNELGKSADVGFEIGILGIDDDDLASYSAGYKDV
jgi:hypothetical protein